MRISDWSSDVCSSDLRRIGQLAAERDQKLGVLRRALQHQRPVQVVPGLVVRAAEEILQDLHVGEGAADHHRRNAGAGQHPAILSLDEGVGLRVRIDGAARSEEHTSELQSLMRISYAVFCLKKKNKNKRL